MHGVYHVVGESHVVVGTEILLVFVYRVLVETPGRSNPNMSEFVLRKSVHAQIRDLFGKDYTAFFRVGRLAPFIDGTRHGNRQD